MLEDYCLVPTVCVLLSFSQMMLVEAGRGQEARELDDTLMGYLRNDVCNPDDTDGGDVTESKRILTAQA